MLGNRKCLMVFCIIFSIVTVSCTTVSIQSVSKLTTQQRRQITTQLIQGSYEDIYRATMTVLQDRNCVVKKTNMKTGLIFAKEESGEVGGDVLMLIGGLFGETTTTDDVRVLEIGCVLTKVDDTASQLRINIQESTLTIKETRGSDKDSVLENAIAIVFTESDKEYELKTKPIYDMQYYRKLFTEIAVEVKRREAIN